MFPSKVTDKILISDVDGVMNDGKLLIGPDGEEPYKNFNVKDGMGIKLLHIRPLYNNLLDDYAEELNFLPDGIMTFIDTVSDTDKHPGKKSHEQSGKNIYKFLKDKGYFDEICI